MGAVSIGDMAQTFQLRRQNAELRLRQNTLAQELTSGLKADISRAVGGDFSGLAGIDRSLATLEAFRVTAAESEHFAANMQAVLEVVQDLADDLAPAMANAGMTGGPLVVDTVTADCRQKFETVVAALNVEVAGRHVFSGAATDRPPLTSAPAILATLQSVTAGQVTADGYAAALTAWFDAPPGGGGYIDMAYQGSATPAGALPVGPGQSVSLNITAADPEIRDLLKGLALGAMIDAGALSGDPGGRAGIAREAAEALLAAGDGVTGLRARVGACEARIDDAAARGAAETSALEAARLRLLAADPYETATALEESQTRLETMYTITARLSRLSLADFLR